MDDLHLDGLDIDSLEDGIVKDVLIQTREDVYFPDVVIALVRQVDSLQKAANETP